LRISSTNIPKQKIINTLLLDNKSVLNELDLSYEEFPFNPYYSTQIDRIVDVKKVIEHLKDEYNKIVEIGSDIIIANKDKNKKLRRRQIIVEKNQETT
jgi:hypothetical protein